MNMSVDETTLKYWNEELKNLHPDLPKGLIEQTLYMYNRNPALFNQVVEEYKANPTPPVERDIKPVYDTVECSNNLDITE
jgi:hypothetical protein